MEKKKLAVKAIVVEIDGVEEVVDIGSVYFSAWEADCDICGSSGEIKVELSEIKYSDVESVVIYSW